VDIVTVLVGTVRYIFADTNADNVIDTAIGLSGSAAVSNVDFV
jgi:hypothetical protein